MTQKKNKRTKKPAENSGKTLKMKTREYIAALNEAYSAGYAQGWDAHANLPDVKGAQAAAKVGYGKGMKARAKSEKAQARAKGGAKASGKC